MQNFRALGALPPNPRASGGWGLRPQTPIGLQRLGAQPPDPPNSSPHCKFLATRLQRVTIKCWHLLTLHNFHIFNTDRDRHSQNN